MKRNGPTAGGWAMLATTHRKLDLEKRAELERAARQMWANLSPNYPWLKNWEYV
jgi:hypothetical protein